MTIKLRAWFFMRNNGDGSVSAVPFPSKALAENEAEEWTEKLGHERYFEDIYYDTIEIDNDEVVPPDYLY